MRVEEEVGVGSTWNRRSVLRGVTAGEYTGSMPVNSSAKFPVSSSFFSSGLKGLATFFSASSAQLSPWGGDRRGGASLMSRLDPQRSPTPNTFWRTGGGFGWNGWRRRGGHTEGGNESEGREEDLEKGVGLDVLGPPRP